MTLRKRSGIIVNSILVLASVVLSVAAFELFLVWDNWRPRFEHTTLEFEGRKFRLLERPESLREFRDALGVVGDSFTAGLACGGERNYPGHLARLVRNNGERYRVINLGVSGADPFMYLQLVEGLRSAGRLPSSLLVTLYANDIEYSCSVCGFLDRIRKDPSFSAEELERLESFCRSSCSQAQNTPTEHFSWIRRAHTWLYTNLHVYGLLRDTLARLAMRAGINVGWGRTAYPPLWQDHDSLQFRLLKHALAGIRDASGGRGVARMMVVLYPDVQNIGRDNVYFGIYHGVEGELSRFLGVPVFSGYPAFLEAADAKQNMPYSLTDNHPSCKAHEIFARWVFGQLAQTRLEPPARIAGH